MATRELERFARDIFRDEGLYRAALAAGESCRGLAELEEFFRTLGYDIRAADLRAAQGLMPSAPAGRDDRAALVPPPPTGTG